MKTVRCVYGWFTAFLITVTASDTVANGWMSEKQSDGWDATLTLVFLFWLTLTGVTLAAAFFQEDSL